MIFRSWSNRALGTFMVFSAAMLWASDAPFRAQLTRGLSSGFIVFIEHCFGAALTLPWLWRGRRILAALPIKSWLAAFAIAAGGSAMASVAFTQAFIFVSPSVAILLQKLQPLVAIALAAWILNERPGRGFWLWACLALAGAYLISFGGFRPQVFPGETLEFRLAGVLLSLLAAVLWGSSTVLGRYLLGSLDYRLATAVRFALGLIVLFVWNFFANGLEFASAAGRDWIFLAAVALASGVFSLLLYYRGLSATPASVATLAELGFPLAAVLVNWKFLGQSLLPWQIVGALVLLAAVFMLARGHSRVNEGV